MLRRACLYLRIKDLARRSCYNGASIHDGALSSFVNAQQLSSNVAHGGRFGAPKVRPHAGTRHVLPLLIGQCGRMKVALRCCLVSTCTVSRDMQSP